MVIVIVVVVVVVMIVIVVEKSLARLIRSCSGFGLLTIDEELTSE